MIHGISSAVALIASVAVCVFVPVSFWWLIPLWLGFYVASAVLFIVLLFVISALLPKENHDYPWVRRFLVIAVQWILFSLRFIIRVEGADKLPADRRFLLVGNHCSGYDPMITMVAFRRYPMVFISKPENFRIPVAGALMRNAAFLSIDRDSARNAVETIRKAADYIREGNLSVGVYPEGTRSKTGELLPFRSGAFKIAKLADNCPIAVVTVRYEKRTLFGKTVRLTVADVLDSQTVANRRTNEISDLVRQSIEANLK